MFWLFMVLGCDEQVATTVGGVPIDESVVDCGDSLAVHIASHSAAAHVINVAVCIGDRCDLTPEPGSITQTGAQITLDCSLYEEGASLRVRSIRLQ